MLFINFLHDSVLLHQPSSCTSVVWVYTLPKFLNQWKSLTLKRLGFNIVRRCQLQLKCCPLLFHNYTWFNIKASGAHHLLLEADKPIAKDAIELFSGTTGFCCN